MAKSKKKASKGKRHPSWAVAAAFLLIEGVRMHYQSLTRLVVGTGLTTLGVRGRTPSQTMKTKLIEMSDIFDGGEGNGYYWLKDPDAVAQTPAVRGVLLEFSRQWYQSQDLPGKGSGEAPEAGAEDKKS